MIIWMTFPLINEVNICIEGLVCYIRAKFCFATGFIVEVKKKSVPPRVVVLVVVVVVVVAIAVAVVVVAEVEVVVVVRCFFERIWKTWWIDEGAVLSSFRIQIIMY